ncbi:MAG: hypothetical protein HY843_02625 [Bdellovibrio sp.]|nr:hypothetical protein [Bdellovibrio sp.]
MKIPYLSNVKFQFRFLVYVIVFFSFFSCQRSQNFKKEQTYFQHEPPSYYNKTGPTSSLTKRVEMMGQPKKRVLVLNFFNDTPVRISDLSEFSASELKRNLMQSQRVILPTEIVPELTTQDVLEGAQIKLSQLVREGKRSGVAIIVIGKIAKIVFRQKGDDVGLFRQKQSIAAVDVEIKVFDVAGGREILATAKAGEASSNAVTLLDNSDIDSPEFRAELIKLSIRQTVELLSNDVLRSVEKLTWQGHVAKVVNSKVYINAGKESGLVVGDILRVLSQGEDIYDPPTGSYLGKTTGQLKGTLEVIDFVGTDGAVSVVHSGANFQVGDSVQLY